MWTGGCCSTGCGGTKRGGAWITGGLMTQPGVGTCTGIGSTGGSTTGTGITGAGAAGSGGAAGTGAAGSGAANAGFIGLGAAIGRGALISGFGADA
jgi:hypothetical protein